MVKTRFTGSRRHHQELLVILQPMRMGCSMVGINMRLVNKLIQVQIHTTSNFVIAQLKTPDSI